MVNLRRNLFNVIANRPMEAVGFCISLLMVLSAIWILLPWWEPADSPTISVFKDTWIAKGFGIWFLILFGTHSYAIMAMHWPARLKVRRSCTYLAALTFFVLALLRIIAVGSVNLMWVTFLILGLIEAISHIRLKFGLDVPPD
jgi:hypothetical protein